MLPRGTTWQIGWDPQIFRFDCEFFQCEITYLPPQKHSFALHFSPLQNSISSKPKSNRIGNSSIAVISRSSSYWRSRHTGSGLPINSDRSGRLAATNLGHRQGEIESEPMKLGAKPEALMLSLNDGVPKITKLLLKVNIERSLGPVNVVMSTEKTIGDLIKAATEIYVKEKRRSLLAKLDPESFQLHYSQFCLESLSLEEKLVNLGSRNWGRKITEEKVRKLELIIQFLG